MCNSFGRKWRQSFAADESLLEFYRSMGPPAAAESLQDPRHCPGVRCSQEKRVKLNVNQIPFTGPGVLSCSQENFEIFLPLCSELPIIQWLLHSRSSQTQPAAPLFLKRGCNNREPYREVGLNTKKDFPFLYMPMHSDSQCIFLAHLAITQVLHHLSVRL